MKKKILIIDDDKEICDELKEILEDEGYSVEISLDGLEGFEMIEKNDYDIILQDIKLPGLDGVELLKKTKSINNKIKIIILTGRPLASRLLNENKQFKKEEDDIFRLADAVFNKPFDIVKLLNKIEILS